MEAPSQPIEVSWFHSSTGLFLFKLENDGGADDDLTVGVDFSLAQSRVSDIICDYQSFQMNSPLSWVTNHTPPLSAATIKFTFTNTTHSLATPQLAGMPSDNTMMAQAKTYEMGFEGLEEQTNSAWPTIHTDILQESQSLLDLSARSIEAFELEHSELEVLVGVYRGMEERKAFARKWAAPLMTVAGLLLIGAILSFNAIRPQPHGSSDLDGVMVASP